MWRRFILYLASARVVQAVRIYFGEFWVLIRKNDQRFMESARVHYEGDHSVAPTKLDTDRTEWETLVIFRLDEKSPPAFIAVDDVFGYRLACLGRMINPGEKIALRVGYEDADAFFIAPKIPPFRPPRINFVLRCTEGNILGMSGDRPVVL